MVCKVDFSCISWISVLWEKKICPIIKKVMQAIITPFLWVRFLFQVLWCGASTKKRRILIYQDRGVSPESFHHTFHMLKKFFPDKYEIKGISGREVIRENWGKNTDLFVIPGGADIPFMQILEGKGNQKIQTYVDRGGAFLGICAGAYYGGGKVEFALNTPMQVNQIRELNFFPGIVRGPHLASFDYFSQSGVRAAKIYGEKFYPFKTFYNGGGYFVDPKQYKNVSVLAYYDSHKKFPAIVECRVGQGKAILSGVHFEYNPELLDKNDFFLKTIVTKLQKHNQSRIQFLKDLFLRLKISEA